MLVRDLQDKYDALCVQLNAFNERVKEEFSRVQEAADAYNGALDKAADFTREVADELDETLQSRDENECESADGKRAAEMLGDWQSFEVQSPQVELPDDLEPPENAASDLVSLPVSSEG